MDTEITGLQSPSPSGSGEAEPERDRPRLRLHVPQHHPAPGERPDFSALPRFAAGAVGRPDISAPAPETHPLAYQLIRVLDDEGDAIGAWDPKLSPETLRRGLRAMMLTRAYDDRMFRQQRQGKISFYMKCTGEEAISSHQEIAGGETATFAARAIGFGLASLRVDGNDFLAVYGATKWAAERARANHGATLIELFTYRMAPHSTSDDPTRYRPEDEGQNWPYGDPIERLSRHLIRLGEWSPERHKQLDAELVDHVREVGREAESYGTMQTGPHFSVKTMFEDVFQEMPWHLRRQRQELGV